MLKKKNLCIGWCVQYLTGTVHSVVNVENNINGAEEKKN